MKARLPKGYGRPDPQAMMRQVQKMQDEIRYNIKHIQILDPAPVNGIRNLDCCLIIFLFYEFFYLLRFQAIFILIQ